MPTCSKRGQVCGTSHSPTVYQQIANGKLRARKVGRDWQVTPREVERYRAENRRG